MINVEWAENEIKLAKEEADDFNKNLLDAAFQAYMKFYKEGRTGYSVDNVSEIIKRLLEQKPLTPIKDLQEEWVVGYEGDDRTDYVSKRLSTLIKSVSKDGTVTYDDLNRSFCVDVSTGDVSRFRFGLDLVNVMYPIKMPYYPQLGYFKVYYKYLEDPEGICFEYLIKPDGEKVTLNWSYTYDKAGYGLIWRKNKHE